MAKIPKAADPIWRKLQRLKSRELSAQRIACLILNRLKKRLTPAEEEELEAYMNLSASNREFVTKKMTVEHVRSEMRRRLMEAK